MTRHLLFLLTIFLSGFFFTNLLRAETKSVISGNLSSSVIPPEDTTSIFAALSFDKQLDHYDNTGFPESSNGELVLRNSPDGPVVPFAGLETALLYAQFVNEQREAVLLARSGDLSDTLPDGKECIIPYGYGALKQNEVFVSLVEGKEIPHLSDDQKKYSFFPLQDFYLGAAIGLSGVTANFRYTYQEKYAGYLSLGANVWGSLLHGSVFGSYLIPLHIGGGYRFPGIFPSLLGRNNITLGLDLFTGWGKPINESAGSNFCFLPGLYLDFEKIFFRGTTRLQDFRHDAKPYNYGVNSFYLRLGMYLNTVDPLSKGFLVFDLCCGFLFSFKGPAIPAHSFKETKTVFSHTLYREELARQQQLQKQRDRM